MLPIRLMRSAVALLSALFGGVGVFCAIYSGTIPSLASYAVILLGSALAITYISDRAKRSPPYVVSSKDGRSYRLLDRQTGEPVEFLETPSLEFINEACRQHKRAQA